MSVTYPLDHFRRIYSPSNFRLSQKTKKIKFVPIRITIIMLPKINLEHLELLRPWGPQIQLPGGPRPGVHDTNFNTQCYKDAIDLTSRRKVTSILDNFFLNEAQKVLYKPVLISDLISHFMWNYSLSNFRKFSCNVSSFFLQKTFFARAPEK